MERPQFMNKPYPPVVRLFDMTEIPRIIKHSIFCCLFDQIESNYGNEFYLIWDRRLHNCRITNKWLDKQTGCYDKYDNVRILFRYHEQMELL